MRPTRVTFLSALLVPAILLSSPAGAQRAPHRSPVSTPRVHVATFSPDSAASPGTVITISFDRPIAGDPGSLVPPERIVRITPAIAARYEWRDPVTIRIVPRDLLVSGQQYVVSIDTVPVNRDGARLPTPFRATVTVRKSRYLGSEPHFSLQARPTLGFPGRIKLLIDEVTDTSGMKFTLHLDNSRNCRDSTIAYRVVSQRALASNDGALRYSGMWWRDDRKTQERVRILEIAPDTPPPEECNGDIVLAPLARGDAEPLRYAVQTAPRLRIDTSCFVSSSCGQSTGIRLAFSAPVPVDSLKRHVRLTGGGQLWSDSARVDQGYGNNSIFIPGTLAYHTPYRLIVDSTIRDGFGRLLRGTGSFGIRVPDRAPTVGYHADMVFVPRSDSAVLRVRHLNMMIAALSVASVPDSLAFALLRSGALQRKDHAPIPPPTVFKSLAFQSRLNVTAFTDVPLLIDASQSPLRMAVVTVRAEMKMRFERETIDASGTVQTSVSSAPIERTMFPNGFADTLPLPLAIVQATDLVVHAKSGGTPMSALVLDRRTGRPVAGARVSWRDALGAIVTSGITDASGVATATTPTFFQALLWRAPGSDQPLANALSPSRVAFVDVVTTDDRVIVRTAPANGNAQWQQATGSQYNNDDASGLSNIEGYHRGLVYTERGIYRPGEKLFIGALVREGVAHALRPPPIGDSLKVEICEVENYWNEVSIYSAVHPLTESGTSSDSLIIPSHWRLGDYVVLAYVHRNGTWTSIDRSSFQLLEYRTPEFLVTVRSDSTPVFIGGAGRVNVSGTFLFGAPMAGATVRWSATMQPASFSIKSLPAGFVIGPQASWWESSRPAAFSSRFGTDTLGRDGFKSLVIKTDSISSAQPVSATVSVAVSDVNRQQVTASTTLLLHSSSVYVALRTPGYGVARAGVPLNVELQTVSPTGRRVSGQLVHAVFVAWRWALGAPDNNGDRTGQWVRDTVWRDTLRTADSTLVVRVTPAQSGPGELVVTTVDERGRQALSSTPIWTIAGGVSYASRSPERLTIFAPRTPLVVGQEGVVRFESPFDSAEVWTTVEREGLLWQDRRLAVRGANEVRIPVDSTFAPGAVVSVLLVPRNASVRGAALSDRMRIGYAPLTVDVSRRRLAVTIIVPDAYQTPRDTVHLIIRARDNMGRPVRGRVTVWATDEGVLSLSEWRAPDPFRMMAASAARGLSDLATDQFDGTVRPEFFSNWYNSMVMRMNASTNRLSEVTIASTQKKTMLRDTFRPTAFFQADVLLDEHGEGQVVQRLPDNLTTFRVFAVVTDTSDRAGAAETDMLVTKPLLIRAALPRFVRAGDSVLAGGIVNARESNVARATVSASGSLMHLIADSTTSLALHQGGTEVRFPWRVREGDSARVTLRVSGRSDRGTLLSDAVTTVLPVQPTGRPRVHAVTGVIRNREIVSLALPAGTDLNRSRLTVRIGTTPLSQFALARRFFDAYPYDCTEQLASHLRVLLADLALERAGLLAASDSLVTRSNAQTIADAIAKRNDDYRGLRYWSTDGDSPLWLNAYAGMALFDARDAGLAVSASVLESLTNYLNSKADDQELRDTIHGTRDERQQAYAAQHATELSLAWYLRRAGDPEQELEKRLALRVGEFAWDDRAWYAEFLAKAGHTSEARTMLQQLWADVKPAGAMVDVPSSPGAGGFYAPIRPMARLMSATMAIWPDHPQLSALAERMMQRDRARRRWNWNTLDYGWMMPALASFLVTLKPGDAVLTMNTVKRGNDRAPFVAPITLTAAGGSAADTSMSLAAFARNSADSVYVDIQFASNGTPVYYVVTVDEVSKAPPVTPDRRGLAVERWYERLSDGKPITEVNAGELIRVRLRVTAVDDRDFVAVEDALPAGLEAVDLSLRTSRALGPFLHLNDPSNERSSLETAGGAWRIGFGSIDNGWWTPWDHKELRDDKVRWFAQRLWQGTHTLSYIARATTAGRFIRPPAVAEEMYNAGVNGRSDGGWFRVLDKDGSRH